ncbi:MAG TPA: hypothetical protein DCR48_08815 [Flavobacteriales bacterium]|nr:hypothetical protein [Flavobacteriales bacterium]
MTFNPLNSSHPRPSKHIGSCSRCKGGARKDTLETGRIGKRPKPYEKRNRTLGPISKARLKGEQSEKSVLKVLKELVGKNELPKAVEEIRRYPDNSPEDQQGYDISYLTDLGRIDLQVKSSWRSREKFLVKHPDIICIVVEDPGDKKVIIAQLLDEILSAYTKFDNTDNGVTTL